MTTQAKNKKTKGYDRPHYCPYCGHDKITSGGFSGVGTINQCSVCLKRFIVILYREEPAND
jgi:transcription elongation factor Elf1